MIKVFLYQSIIQSSNLCPLECLVALGIWLQKCNLVYCFSALPKATELISKSAGKSGLRKRKMPLEPISVFTVYIHLSFAAKA